MKRTRAQDTSTHAVAPESIGVFAVMDEHRTPRLLTDCFCVVKERTAVALATAVRPPPEDSMLTSWLLGCVARHAVLVNVETHPVAGAVGDWATEVAGDSASLAAIARLRGRHGLFSSAQASFSDIE